MTASLLKSIFFVQEDVDCVQSDPGVRSATMSTVEPSSRVGVTLDLILKTLIASADFNTLSTKNWEAIARLIPGTTPSQVSFPMKNGNILCANWGGGEEGGVGIVDSVCVVF